MNLTQSLLSSRHPAYKLIKEIYYNTSKEVIKDRLLYKNKVAHTPNELDQSKWDQLAWLEDDWRSGAIVESAEFNIGDKPVGIGIGYMQIENDFIVGEPAEEGIGYMVVGSTFYIGRQPSDGISSVNYRVGSTFIVGKVVDPVIEEIIEQLTALQLEIIVSGGPTNMFIDILMYDRRDNSIVLLKLDQKLKEVIDFANEVVTEYPYGTLGIFFRVKQYVIMNPKLPDVSIRSVSQYQNSRRILIVPQNVDYRYHFYRAKVSYRNKDYIYEGLAMNNELGGILLFMPIIQSNMSFQLKLQAYQ